MNINLAMLSALMIVMTIGVNAQAADLTDWMVVDGESKGYLDSKEAELVLRVGWIRVLGKEHNQGG